MDGGEHRDAEINAPAVALDDGPPLLRNVVAEHGDLRQHLQAGEHPSVTVGGYLCNVGEQSINAEPHPQGGVEGIEVDVTGLMVHGLKQKEVDRGGRLAFACR